MKYPKFRCAGVVVFTGLAVGVAPPGAAADSKGAVRAPGNASGVVTPAVPQHDASGGSNPLRRDATPPNSPASNPPPTPPSNVRIKVQTSDSAAAATLRPDARDPASAITSSSRVLVAAALDAQNFAPTLRAASATAREKILSDVESRVTAAEGALNALEKSNTGMSAEGRQQFQVTATDAREKATALRKSIQAVRRASSDEWEGARGQLAADYHAYAAAMARIDSVTGVAPAAR